MKITFHNITFRIENKEFINVFISIHTTAVNTYLWEHIIYLLFLFLMVAKGLFKGAPLSIKTPSSETPILPETFNSSKQLQH